MKKPPFEAAAAAVRAELLAAEHAAQSRPRDHVHTLEELLHGAEVPDVPSEAARWAKQVLANRRELRLNETLANSFGELAQEADGFMLEMVMNGCHAVAGPKPRSTVDTQHHRWATQAALYLMLLGHRRAAQNLVCQVHKLLETDEHTSLGYYQTTVTLHEALAVGMAEDRDAKPGPRLYARLKAEHTLAMISDVVLLREAATSALIEDADPAGFMRPSEPEDDDVPNIDVADLERTYPAPLRPVRRSVRQVAASVPAAPAPTAGPALRPLVTGSLDHLGKGPMAAYRTSAKAPLPSVVVPDLAEVREALIADAPWAAAEIQRMLAPLAGRDRVVVPGHLLVGAQGSGKTEFAVRYLEALGLVTSVFPAGGTADGASWGGTSRMYNSARLSVPGQLMLSAGSVTVGIVVDEGDKIGATDLNGSLTAALLAMTEPSRRHAYRDPGLDAETDLSGLSLIVTANRKEPLVGPLLDRLVCVPWPSPRRQDLPVVVRGIMRALRREAGTDAVWLPDLDAAELRALQGWAGGSMRPLRRAIERLVALRSDPRLAN